MGIPDATSSLGMAVWVDMKQTKFTFFIFGSNQNEFIFRKVVKNYKIRNDKTNEQTDFGLDPLLTIKEVINFVEYCNFKSTNYSLQTRAPHENSTPKYDIILLSSGARLKMDYFRTLISYKLKNDVRIFSNLFWQQNLFSDNS